MKNKYRFLCRVLIFMFILNVNQVYAQEKTVTGKVISEEDNAALPGVNVLVKGTSSGTVTDIDGNYSISVPENTTLVFSFIGYASQEVVVGNRTVIDVKLGSDVRSLSEVVVIGYGEVQKRDATGAVSSVKAEDFNVGVISSPEQLIQGKSAGVQITQASGEPGAGVNIRIRGTSSVRGGNNPLFVVDGVPLSGEDVSAGGADIGRGSSSARNPLNFINPNDIESIDILKDASATAIYGSRGANGVVLITTKSGKGKKNQIEYGTSLSVSKMANKYDLLNRSQFLNALEDMGADAEALDEGADTDWQDEISRTAVSHRHDLSYANNYKSGNIRASVSYDNQQGIIKNSALERLTGRLNLNNSFFQDKLKFAGQLTLSRVNDQAAPITDNAGFEGDLLGAAYMANPTWPSDPDIQLSSSNANPNSLLKYTQDNTETTRSLINLSLGYDITKDLNFKVNTGFDNTSSVREGAYSPALFLSSGVFENGRGYSADNKISSQLLETVLSYDKSFTNSSLSAVLGYSYQEFNREGFTVAGWGFSNPDMNTMISDLNTASSRIQAAIGNQSYQQFGYEEASGTLFINQLFPEPSPGLNIDNVPSSPVRTVIGENFKQTDELQSFFGRLNYTLYDKYLFTATLRADGSTKFGGNNKYGYFPSAAIAWRLSDEEFIPNFFDDLKLRLGFGVTGNQEIPHNLHQSRQRFRGMNDPDPDNQFEIQNGGTIKSPGINNVAFQNPDLKWEQTSQLNFGMDYGIIQSRINGSIDVYRKVTTDLLMQVFAAQPSPQNFTWQNLDADVINSGVEFTLNYHAIDNETSNLTIGANLAYNDNVVKNYNSAPVNTGQVNGQGLTGAFAQQIANNHPLYAYYLREFIGFGEDGIAMYEGGIDNQTFVGKSPIPTYNLGLSINFKYANWDLSTFFNGQFGHYIYNNTANAYFTMGSINNGRNVTQNVPQSNESPLNAPDVSTLFLEKGDFLRFQNLNIGYNFNLEGKFIKSLRLSATGQNLFVITDYSGLDPEVNVNKALNGVPSLGIDYTAYPRARTYTLSLNATF